MTNEELIDYCQHYLKIKENQTFAINAGFHDERLTKWGCTRGEALTYKQIYTDSAQATLEDAQNGMSLAVCEVCHKPLSTRAVWCIYCGHPQPISKGL